MENPFKDIVENEKLPEGMKGKVMHDVAFIKLTIDVMDLTLVQYPSLVENIIRSASHKK